MLTSPTLMLSSAAYLICDCQGMMIMAVGSLMQVRQSYRSRLALSFMNIHARLSRLLPLWIIIQINFHVGTLNKEITYQFHWCRIRYNKQSRPYQAALTRAAWSGSVLFAKVLKGISMMRKRLTNYTQVQCSPLIMLYVWGPFLWTEHVTKG